MLFFFFFNISLDSESEIFSTHGYIKHYCPYHYYSDRKWFVSKKIKNRIECLFCDTSYQSHWPDLRSWKDLNPLYWKVFTGILTVLKGFGNKPASYEVSVKLFQLTKVFAFPKDGPCLASRNAWEGPWAVCMAMCGVLQSWTQWVNVCFSCVLLRSVNAGETLLTILYLGQCGPLRLRQTSSSLILNDWHISLLQMMSCLSSFKFLMITCCKIQS